MYTLPYKLSNVIGILDIREVFYAIFLYRCHVYIYSNLQVAG